MSQFTTSKSDLADTDYADAYQGRRWKILLIGADERYLPTGNDSLFSTGNHPIETLLPMYHMDKAGFDFGIATLSGNPIKVEWWAFPQEDAEIQRIHAKYQNRFVQPQKLADVIADKLSADSDYIAVFIPGGHGALIAPAIQR